MGEDATMGEAKPERTSGVSLDIVKVSLSRVLLFSFVHLVLINVVFLNTTSIPILKMLGIINTMILKETH